MLDEKSKISRDTYKKIKAMNREQMNDFLTGIYQEGVNDSQIDLDELREVIGSVSGIGEVRLNQIMDAIAAHYGTEETKQE
ncbi:MAG: hypothetical protein J6A19_06640 [Oscillospiraceae bacterium]|nr:hypothetical protein [Oscillospiraceae bacterium]